MRFTCKAAIMIAISMNEKTEAQGLELTSLMSLNYKVTEPGFEPLHIKNCEESEILLYL